MYTIIAVDPGLDGAIAALKADATLTVWDMPTHEKVVGSGVRREIVRATVAQIFAQFDPKESEVWIEDVGGLPGQSAPAAFQFGVGAERVACLAWARGLPMHFVAPARWKRAVGIKSKGKKDDSRARAAQVYPGNAALWAAAKDHGRAEAALLAYYGMEQRQLRCIL